MFSSTRRRVAALAAMVVLVGASAAAITYGIADRQTPAAAPAARAAASSTATTTGTVHSTANTSGPLTIGEVAKNATPGVVEIVTSGSSTGAP